MHVRTEDMFTEHWLGALSALLQAADDAGERSEWQLLDRLIVDLHRQLQLVPHCDAETLRTALEHTALRLEQLKQRAGSAQSETAGQLRAIGRGRKAVHAYL